jgi:uncharacterized protein DUF4136
MSRLTLMCAAVMLISGATVSRAQDVKTDFDPGTNFSTLKTYYWAKSDPVPGNDLMNQRVVAAVDHWLTVKGWTKAPEERADVAVAVSVSTKQSTSVETLYNGMAGWGYRGWGAGMGSATTMVNTYTDGTMLVDLFDAKTKKLVWRGTATGTVSNDPRKNAEKIQKVTEKMFKKKFPPGAPSTD